MMTVSMPAESIRSVCKFKKTFAAGVCLILRIRRRYYCVWRLWTVWTIWTSECCQYKYITLNIKLCSRYGQVQKICIGKLFSKTLRGLLQNSLTQPAGSSRGGTPRRAVSPANGVERSLPAFEDDFTACRKIA